MSLPIRITGGNAATAAESSSTCNDHTTEISSQHGPPPINMLSADITDGTVASSQRDHHLRRRITSTRVFFYYLSVTLANTILRFRSFFLSYKRTPSAWIERKSEKGEVAKRAIFIPFIFSSNTSANSPLEFFKIIFESLTWHEYFNMPLSSFAQFKHWTFGHITWRGRQMRIGETDRSPRERSTQLADAGAHGASKTLSSDDGTDDTGPRKRFYRKLRRVNRGGDVMDYLLYYIYIFFQFYVDVT